jgi:hypothetical protein
MGIAEFYDSLLQETVAHGLRMIHFSVFQEIFVDCNRLDFGAMECHIFSAHS